MATVHLSEKKNQQIAQQLYNLDFDITARMRLHIHTHSFIRTACTGGLVTTATVHLSGENTRNNFKQIATQSFVLSLCCASVANSLQTHNPGFRHTSAYVVAQHGLWRRLLSTCQGKGHEIILKVPCTVMDFISSFLLSKRRKSWSKHADVHAQVEFTYSAYSVAAGHL